MSPLSAPIAPAVDVAAAVRETARELMGSEVSADAPLMEAGLDSLGATEFQSRLSQRLGGDITLSNTLIFDFPTLRQIEAHVTTLLPATSAAAPTAAAGGLPPGLLQILAQGTSPIRQAQHTALATCPALSGTSRALSGGVTTGYGLWQLSVAAHDSIVQVPTARWPAGAATSVDEIDEGGSLARTRHGGFICGAEHFDNHAFSISTAEARAADPQQRLILECSYAALHQAGNKREALLGTGTGVAVGIYAVEFGQILQESPLRASVYAVTSSALSIASGRISFILGLHGPCTSFETACSASLVAGHSASRALQHGDCKLHMAAGVNLMLLPAFGELMAKAGMTSKAGKSHTFDQRADGFARGEGSAVVVLDSGGEENTDCLGGSAVRQDGRSASLTAPNGQAQQGMLRAALDDTAASAERLVTAEAHGTGTALGDPIEAGSLDGAVLRGRPSSCAPVGVCGVKASVGHAESAAGLVGLLRLAAGLVRGGAPPNAQLRELNPHIRGVMRGSGGMMPTQLATVGIADLQVGVEQGMGGVNSFGYSGTIAHAVLLQQSSALVALSAPTPRVYRRRAFPWREAPHPFVQLHVPSTGDASVYRSDPRGALHALIANHVVQGRVIFPGAGYLEMARAAASPGAALCGVFFLQLLTIGAVGLFIECTVTNGRFEVSSGEEDALTEATVHCSGALATNSLWNRVDYASVRSTACRSAAHVDALYDNFDAAGLQYGPGYRTLLQGWAREGDAAARLRSRTTQLGTEVHPADLDDALCTRVLGSNTAGGETQLPFAVDDVVLQAAVCAEPWAVR